MKQKTYLAGETIGEKIDNLVSYLKKHHPHLAEFIASQTIKSLCNYGIDPPELLKIGDKLATRLYKTPTD